MLCSMLRPFSTSYTIDALLITLKSGIRKIFGTREYMHTKEKMLELFTFGLLAN